MLHLADAHVVAIEQLVVGGGHVVQKGLHGHFELPHFTGPYIGRRNVTAQGLDVDVGVDFAIAESADAILEFRCAAMGLSEGKVFVDLQVQLDKHVAVLLGSGDVMDLEAKALGHGTNGFEQMLVARRTWLGMDNDIGGHDLRDALFDPVGEGVYLF